MPAKQKKTNSLGKKEIKQKNVSQALAKKIAKRQQNIFPSFKIT
jgi:hypothetical protein